MNKLSSLDADDGGDVGDLNKDKRIDFARGKVASEIK